MCDFVLSFRNNKRSFIEHVEDHCHNYFRKVAVADVGWEMSCGSLNSKRICGKTKKNQQKATKMLYLEIPKQGLKFSATCGM